MNGTKLTEWELVHYFANRKAGMTAWLALRIVRIYSNYRNS